MGTRCHMVGSSGVNLCPKNRARSSGFARFRRPDEAGSRGEHLNEFLMCEIDVDRQLDDVACAGDTEQVGGGEGETSRPGGVGCRQKSVAAADTGAQGVDEFLAWRTNSSLVKCRVLSVGRHGRSARKHPTVRPPTRIVGHVGHVLGPDRGRCGRRPRGSPGFRFGVEVFIREPLRIGMELLKPALVVEQLQ